MEGVHLALTSLALREGELPTPMPKQKITHLKLRMVLHLL